MDKPGAQTRKTGGASRAGDTADRRQREGQGGGRGNAKDNVVGGYRVFDGGEKAVGVDGAGQAVAVDFFADWAFQFGEDQGDAIFVQFQVQLFQDVGGCGVDVGYRFGGNHDPGGWRVRGGQVADLVAEGAGVGEDQGASKRKRTRPGRRSASGYWLMSW